MQGHSGARSQNFREHCGGGGGCWGESVGTAVAAKCLMPQETAGWREGGAARQLGLNNAYSANSSSPTLGRAARAELLPWQADSFHTPLPRPVCSFVQRQRKNIGSLLQCHLSERPSLAMRSRITTFPMPIPLTLLCLLPSNCCLPHAEPLLTYLSPVTRLEAL